MRPFLRRNSPEESEHDRLINFKERILLANIRIHQQVNLLPYQQIDNGKIHIIAEDALLHAFLEKVHRFFRVLIMPFGHQLIGFGILLDVLKKLLVGGMELFDTALVAFQQDFQYILGCSKHILQIFIPLFLTSQDTLFQQGLLIRKHLIQSTLGDAQRSCDVIHRNTFDTLRSKGLHRSFNDPLSQFRTRSKVLGIFAHFSSF